MSERRGRIHEKHDLSKTRRCELLDLAHSSAYYRREPVSEGGPCCDAAHRRDPSPVAVLRQPAYA